MTPNAATYVGVRWRGKPGAPRSLLGRPVHKCASVGDFDSSCEREQARRAGGLSDKSARIRGLSSHIVVEHAVHEASGALRRRRICASAEPRDKAYGSGRKQDGDP